MYSPSIKKFGNQKSRTHFDEITESPEKLAAFVAETYGSAICPKDNMTCGKKSTCEKCWLAWLNSPEED